MRMGRKRRARSYHVGGRGRFRGSSSNWYSPVGAMTEEFRPCAIRRTSKWWTMIGRSEKSNRATSTSRCCGGFLDATSVMKPRCFGKGRCARARVARSEHEQLIPAAEGTNRSTFPSGCPSRTLKRSGSSSLAAPSQRSQSHPHEQGSARLRDDRQNP